MTHQPRVKHRVRGHSCPGLDQFQRRGGGCVPVIGTAGIVQGCDDVNPVPILHCPFCGELLAPPWAQPDEWDE